MCHTEVARTREPIQSDMLGPPMEPLTPSDALGAQAESARALAVETVLEVHRNFSAAHEVSQSVSTAGFGTQWRDLLFRTLAAFKARGYPTYELEPGHQKLPIVNRSLIYPWRIPVGRDAIAHFASGPTRLSALSAPEPPITLFDTGFDALDGDVDESESSADSSDEVASVVAAAAAKTMPLVLVLISSSPGNLRSISWAIATLNGDTGEVELSGLEEIWVPEALAVPEIADIEPFDSGLPPVPPVEPNELPGSASDD